MSVVKIIVGDCREMLKKLPDESVHCCVTSPPYWGLRDYGVAEQIGLEPTINQFVSEMVGVFREVRRVLRSDGTLWLNLGDSYSSSTKGDNRTNAQERPRNADGFHSGSGQRWHTGTWKVDTGLKPKDLCGIPWRVAFALQTDGWYLRQDIIWHKPNPMPESVTDRCTKAHEYIFLLTKSDRYFYDAEAIKETAIADHLPGNKSHKGVEAHEAGALGHRTKAGLVAYSGRQKPIVSDDRKDLRSGIESRHRSCIYGGQSLKADPNGRRNKRSVWTVATAPFSKAHFATFPPELIKPCIKAGSSEKGCCSKCGAPWKRMTETEYRKHEKWFGNKQDARHSRGKAGTGYNEPIGTRTLGWQPICKCDAPTVPCTILDPFGGAGTTGLVANRLQRNSILIELNQEYANMAKDRIKDDAKLLAKVELVT